MNLIKNTKFPMPCPLCKAENKIKGEEIINGSTITCIECGKSIHLVDKNGSFKKSSEDVQKGLDDLTQTFKKINLKIG